MSKVTQLEPRVMEVLMYLVSRPGQVVSLATLKDELWGTQYVVHEAVKRCVSQIRKAFDDDPREPETIETLPKRGYRLIAPIEDTIEASSLPVRRLRWRAVASLAACVSLALAVVFLVRFGD